ncbi:hypothetical protein E2F50_02365 [Rhizobium deserti]|uniref:Lipoprotein n=1 Tax=Rhizobium deserti TaxID=2547961 RepID=A0A4R5UMA6_9HYPH|nr:hypothetical protein [Rhizobium deserti]TDK39005.1 hypothetical protein E2F50_02365 [Rhizobium deserti]
MRLLRSFISACLLVVAAASCNTSEALTPRADVGSGTTRSSTPVTQAEADRMARSTTSDAGSGSRSDRTIYRAGPQNSLEAQARALQSGNDVSPASSGLPPQWEGQKQQARQPQTAVTAEPAPQQSGLPAPSGQSPSTIRFLPIIGAPVQAVTPLSRRLGAQARASGLTIRPSSDQATEHILKGYFSAFADDGKVTVVYVWDVLDSTGARLHRMQGQESVPGRGQDPWAAVPASAMEDIATQTIDGYLTWRRSRAG